MVGTKLKLTGAVVILLLCFIVLLVAGERIASEWYEVAVLVTKDEAGEEIETRVWIVDWRGTQYLRAGSKDSLWYNRVITNAKVDVIRGGERSTYCPTFDPSIIVPVGKVFAAKYKWADAYIDLILDGREPLAPVALQRCGSWR